MKSNLLIIGNGFDLRCGIKSSFYDFFNDRIHGEVLNQLNEFFENIDVRDSYRSLYFDDNVLAEGVTIPVNWYDLVKDANLTFWDLLFINKYNQRQLANWHNVEQNMLEILKDIDLSKKYSLIGQHNIKGTTRHRSTLRSSTEKALIKCSIVAYYVIPEERYRNKNNLDDFLVSELKIFEEAFLEYLKIQLRDAYSYFDNAEQLVGSIIGDHISSDDIEVLSFNYTEPKCFNDKITNVHGKLKNSNIIFGIDQEQVDIVSPMYKYTKTFRKMIQIKKRNDDSVYINNKKNLDSIYFYGHSLSSLDYSYFQSIFDYYNLYDSEISLVFCYSKYGTKTSGEILSEHVNLVGQLLEKYGKTMNNSSHGKNLMHKLMLEGRLTIKEI